MREYRKNWVSPRPAAATIRATEGVPTSAASPSSVLSPRPSSRTRLSDTERDLLRQELRDLRIQAAP